MEPLKSLYDKLVSYSKEDYYPMHMPGHKRNTKLMHMPNPYAIDITEIEGFDNLHQAEGILRELSKRLSKLYGSKSSYVLINGSTAGILAGISAAARRGDRVLLARNSHRSVYNAVTLMGLTPVYINPQPISEPRINGGICASEIEEALINYKDISLVVITSPTYEGVVSDIKEISRKVHEHGALLLVDEAHGAHFGLHEGFPKSAVTLGADIVIQSLHKTLPSFTQTAVLHSNIKELDNKLEQYLAIYQSSSPSYLLMAGIDRCISILEDSGKVLFEDYYKRLMEFYSKLESLKGLSILDRKLIGRAGVYDFDISKIIVSLGKTRLTGHKLHHMLRERFHIMMEMESPDYVLAMTSICDTDEGFHRLTEALIRIDKEYEGSEHGGRKEPGDIILPAQIMTPQKALEQRTETMKLTESINRVSASFISMFPPGAPLLVPGELLSKDMIEYILWIKEEGMTVTGLCGEAKDEIELVVDD